MAKALIVRATMLAFAAGLLSSAAVAPAAAAAAATAPAPKRLEPVDMELVIATDVSPSVDSEEAQLQREGTIEAFMNPQVVKAIQAGSLGKIGVVYIDFSAREYNRIVINWTVIKDAASATAFAMALRNAPQGFGRHTSISSAIEAGEFLLEANALQGTRQVIDISGDGPNNWGQQVNLARDHAVAKNITINGLPIIEGEGFGQSVDLDRYFSNCVIGGPAAFTVVAKGFQDFARAIRNKLILEIAGDVPPPEAAPQIIPTEFAPRLIRVAAAAPARPTPPRPQLRTGPKLNEEGCENRFGGGGGFGNFDFPLPTR